MELIDPSYTRVSQILSIFSNYAHVPPAKLKKAQEIGTDVHAAIEAYFRDGFEPLSRSRTPYFESFLKWADVVHPDPIIFEKRFNDENWKITGRIDLLAKIDGKSCLIDFKTGSWVHPEIWELQLTFYRHLLFLHDHVVDDFMIVQLSKDAESPKVYKYKYDSMLLDICMGALDCYRFFEFRRGFAFKS